MAHGGSIISNVFNSLSKEVVAWAQEADCGRYSPFLGSLHLFHVSNCNCSLLSNVCVVTGFVVIHGYIYAVQLGRMAAAGFCAETPVPGCDSGKL